MNGEGGSRERQRESRITSGFLARPTRRMELLFIEIDSFCIMCNIVFLSYFSRFPKVWCYLGHVLSTIPSTILA